MPGPGADDKRPRSAHRVQRVVDQVAPHLVEFGGVGVDSRQGRIEVPDYRDSIADLAAEDKQGAVDKLVKVNVLQRRQVQLRVLTSRIL